jgi:uncharacterized protein YjcR
VPNNEIARTLDVSETTVSNWVTKGGWRDERADANNKKKARVDMMGDLVDYQLESMHQRMHRNRRMAKQYALEERVILTARSMYMIDVDQKTIIDVLGISEEEFKKWAKEGFWIERRENIDNEGVLQSIDKGEVDALTKMFSQMKGKELTFDMIVNQLRDILDFLNQKNPDLAKAVVPFTNDYLAAKKEVLAV